MPLHRNQLADFPYLKDSEAAPHGPEEQEQGLLRRLADGDAAAFWDVWNIHRNYLYSICLREMRGVRADAEDALSRVMIKARVRLPEHAGRISNLKAWLARLTHNQCVDIHRERTRQTRGVENIEEMADADYISLARRIPTPEEMVLQRERRLRLRRLIEDLPPNLGRPFVLHFLQDVSYAEIAVRLNLSDDNVRKRIQQARAFLRGRMSERPAGALQPPACSFGRDPGAAGAGPPPAESAPQRPACEIRSQSVAARLVSVAADSGSELSFEIFLDRAPEASRVESLEAYVRAGRGGWMKLWDRARLLYEEGRWREAADVLRSVLESRPRLLDAHLLLGDILRLTGREGAAGVVYEGALRAASEDASRHHIGGLIKVCQSRWGAAAEEFRRAAGREPHNVAHWNRLGEAHLLAGAHLEALRAFEESLKVRPDDMAALTHSRRALLAVGRAKEAEGLAARALELDPESVPALKCLADSYSLSGDAERGREAGRVIRTALLLAPGAAEVHESLALRHIARGEWEAGLSVLAAFVERNPHSAAGWLCYARWLSRTGAQEEAAECALKAHELNPSGREELELCCELLASNGEVTRLLPLVQEMLARFPECWSVWAAAGLAVLKSTGDAQRACALSAQATRVRPLSAAAWSRHGGVLVLAGRHSAGVAALERAWRRPHDGANDDRVACALLLGESYRLLGEEGRARVWFEKAAQKALAPAGLWPPLAHYRHGQALEALGDTVGAMQSYRAALDGLLFYPERREAQRSLRLLQERVGPGAGR